MPTPLRHRSPTTTPRPVTRPDRPVLRRASRWGHRLGLSSALWLLATLLVVPAAHAGVDHRHVPRAFFGLHDASQQAEQSLPYGSLRLWDAGVTWSEIETLPGVYDWSRLDAYVREAQQHRIQVTLVLAMTPSFDGPSPTLPPTRLSAYADFVRAVMTRYRDFDGARGIAAYEVWNEGNVSTFWTGTPAELAELTRVVWRVRREVDPGARLVGPSFAVRLAGQREWLQAYASQRVHGRPVWRFYDATGLSLYPRASYDGRTGDPEDAIALLARARRVLTRAGVPPGQPVWATEVNYGVTSDGSAAQPLSTRRQVANVIRTYLLGAARGLQRLFWYRYDWGLVAGGTLGNTLLTVPGSDDQVTPAGRALTTVEHWLRGRLVGRDGHPPCQRDRRGTFTCQVRQGGVVRTIWWNPRHRVHVALPRGARTVQRGPAAPSRPLVGRARLAVSYLPVMVSSRP